MWKFWIGCFSIITAAHAAEPDVLLMGNSYIMSNDLAGLVDNVFQDAGYDPNVEKLASGGLTLGDHLDRTEKKGSLWHEALVTGEYTWDWVMIHDQSQIPGFPQSNAQWQESAQAAVGLNEKIETNGAETLFMMTWGRRDGDSQNTFMYPDFSTMQSLLEEGYHNYAQSCSTDKRPAWIAPVGLAFAYIHDEITNSGADPVKTGSLFHDLYVADGSHPSLKGSVLAAYVIYATITGSSPVGLSGSNLGVDGSDLLDLQEAAAATVFNKDHGIAYPWEEDSTDTEEQDTSDSKSDPEDTSEESDSLDSEEEEVSPCGCDGSGGLPLGWLWMGLMIPLYARFRRHRDMEVSVLAEPNTWL